MKDRFTVLAEPLVEPRIRHLVAVKRLHEKDLAAGYGCVELPHALARKYPHACREWGWPAYEYDTTLDATLVDALVPVEQSARLPLPAPTTHAGRRREPAATPPRLRGSGDRNLRRKQCSEIIAQSGSRC